MILYICDYLINIFKFLTTYCFINNSIHDNIKDNTLGVWTHKINRAIPKYLVHKKYIKKYINI